MLKSCDLGYFSLGYQLLKVAVWLCSAEMECGCDLLVAAAHHLGRAPRATATVRHVPGHVRAQRALPEPFRMPPLMCRLATIASCGGRKSERVDAALVQGKAGDVRRLGCERGERRHGRVGLLVGEERVGLLVRDCRRSADAFAPPDLGRTCTCAKLYSCTWGALKRYK